MIDLSFVKAHLELLSYHPVKQQTPIDPQSGRAHYFGALKGALQRFQKADTVGAFPSVALFIQCFDQAVLDYALFQSGLAEEDVR